MSFESFDAGPVSAKLGDYLKSLHPLELLRPKNAAAAGGRIWQMILDALGNIDLSSMTKEEFVSKVDGIYDSVVAPLIAGIGPIGAVINPILNAVVLTIAGNFYDKHSKPATA